MGPNLPYLDCILQQVQCHTNLHWQLSSLSQLLPPPARAAPAAYPCRLFILRQVALGLSQLLLYRKAPSQNPLSPPVTLKSLSPLTSVMAVAAVQWPPMH